MRPTLFATLVAVLALVLPGAATAATTTASPAPAGHVTTTAAPQEARFGSGRGFGSRRTFRPPARSTRFRRSPGRSFFHGLFWGWMLSHFFGGGFPLVFPFLFLLLFLMAAMRRRPRRTVW